MAVWPAFTVSEEVCADIAKSATVNMVANVTPPPGAGFFTTMFSVPPCAIALAGRVAWISVELTNVVGRAAPSIKILEDLLKFSPVTFSVTAALPGTALDGERRLSCGTGLLTGKVTTVDGRPPGLATATVGVPAIAIALAGMLTCNSAAFENVVSIAFPLNVTTEFAVKLFPDKVKVKDGPPAVALAGDRVTTTG